jgi:hypothetical protein
LLKPRRLDLAWVLSMQPPPAQHYPESVAGFADWTFSCGFESNQLRFHNMANQLTAINTNPFTYAYMFRSSKNQVTSIILLGEPADEFTPIGRHMKTKHYSLASPHWGIVFLTEWKECAHLTKDCLPSVAEYVVGQYICP